MGTDGESGLVENEIHALACLASGVEIENARLAEVDMSADLGEVLAPARGEVVDASDFIAPIQKGADQ